MKTTTGSPYKKRSGELTTKAFAAVEKSVKPVAKDTNKTRRPETRERKLTNDQPKVKPVSPLKKDMKRNLGARKP